MEVMEITRLQPEGLVVSPAFSHVAVVPAGATTIYVGGQNGVDDTGAVVSSDVGEQSSRALDNAVVALEAIESETSASGGAAPIESAETAGRH